MRSDFWAFVDSEEFGTLRNRWGKLWNNQEAVAQAARLLLEEAPNSGNWKPNPKGNYTDGNLALELITAIAAGATDTNSPRPVRYHPSVFKFHYDIAELESLLYQFPPIGAVAAMYRSFEGDDGFHQPASNQHLVGVVRQALWESGADGQYWNEPDGAAMLLIAGDRIDVYPFPENWIEVVEKVRTGLDHMTSREQVAITMPFELDTWVKLVGWGPVMDALEALRPRDD